MPKKIKPEEKPQILKLSDVKSVELVSSGTKEIDVLTGGFPRETKRPNQSINRRER